MTPDELKHWREQESPMQATGKLIAGRELNALVAEKVMGWHRGMCEGGHKAIGNRRHMAVGHRCEYLWHWYSGDGHEQELAEPMDDYYSPKFEWSPSTDIAAAWQVVEHFTTLHHDVQVRSAIQGWVCRIAGDWGQEIHHAETAPLAICRAALIAVSQAK